MFIMLFGDSFWGRGQTQGCIKLRDFPSPPSDGGEGWGEEARFYWFPLSSVLSPLVPRGERMEGCIKLLDFSLSSIGWRRGLGRGGSFLLVSPLLGPLPTRSSRGEDGELDAALTSGVSHSLPL